MLSQIELGQSAPTINVLWKVARALEVPFSSLIDRATSNAATVLPARSGKLLANQEGTFTSRALFPFDERRNRTEFYELRLKAAGEEQAHPHPPGTTENLVVTAGAVEIEVDQRRPPAGGRGRDPVQRRRAPQLPERRGCRSGDVPGDDLRRERQVRRSSPPVPR